MRVGVVLWPDEPWPRVREQCVAAEQMGFNHVWVYDHLALWGLQPWHDAYTTLAVAASVTSRIGVGPLVTSPNFRHPVPSAHTARTLATLSGGRFTWGLGSGSPDPTTDAGALGDAPASWRERLDRFVEWVEVADWVLRGRTSHYAGRHYAAGAAAAGAGGGAGEAPAPFAIAAWGPRAMRLAARYAQTWVTLGDPRDWHTPAEQAVREQSARLSRACTEIGRNPATMSWLLLAGLDRERPLTSLDAFRDLASRATQAGITDLVVHWPRESGQFAGDVRVLEQIPHVLAT